MVPVVLVTSNMDNVGSEKMSERPAKNNVLYYIPVLLPVTFKMEFLGRLKPIHDCSKSALFVYHVKL